MKCNINKLGTLSRAFDGYVHDDLLVRAWREALAIVAVGVLGTLTARETARMNAIKTAKAARHNRPPYLFRSLKVEPRAECVICGRALIRDDSVMLGMGRVCAAARGLLPHKTKAVRIARQAKAAHLSEADKAMQMMLFEEGENGSASTSGVK